MVDHLQVKLTDGERELLLRSVDLPHRLQSVIASAQHGLLGWRVIVSSDDADDIREAVGDALMVIGFDERDRPTKEGLLLERMIDKFFTG